MLGDLNIDAFFNEGALARPATYTNAAGTVTKSISIIFDTEPVISPLMDTGVQNARPTALCKTRDIPAVAKNDRLRVNSLLTASDGSYMKDQQGNRIEINGPVEYYVEQITVDPEGFTELMLSQHTAN